MGINKKSGFTLIEMILVILVIGLALPALFSIVFAVLHQQLKIVALQEIKNQGDGVVASIENTVKGQAVSIYSDLALTSEVCSTSGSSYGPVSDRSFYFKDKNGKRFDYFLSEGSIASGSGNAFHQELLTNSNVTVSDFSISCNRYASYSGPIVSLSFTVSYKEGSSINYSSKIKLRNY